MPASLPTKQLGEPKKFNVALTRAQALVIIVGDPWILYHDPCWRRVIATTVTQGSYVPDVVFFRLRICL